jgi:hypothetical protein
LNGILLLGQLELRSAGYNELAKEYDSIQTAIIFSMAMQVHADQLQSNHARITRNFYVRHRGVLNAVMNVDGVTENQLKTMTVSVYAQEI